MFEMVDFEFETASFSDGLLGCVRFVEELRMKDWYIKEKNKLRLRRLASPTEVTRARIASSSLRDNIYAFCQASATCRIRFPYNLHPSAIQGYLRRPENVPFTTSGKKCQTPYAPQPRRTLSAEDLSSRELASLPQANFWIAPVTTLTSEIEKLISKHSEGTIFASAMTASTTQVARLRELMKTKPKLKLYILVNFIQNAIEVEFPDLLATFEDNMFLIPVFPHPSFRGNYHLKGATHLSDSADYVFTSINLNSQTDTPVIDLGFSGKDSRFARGLAQLFVGQAIESCQKLTYFNCTLDLRFRDTHLGRFGAQRAINRGCEAIAKDASQLMKYIDHKSSLLYSLNDNVSLVAANLIRSAKNTLDISSHHMGDPEIMQAILEAKRRGVRVNLFAAPFLFSDSPVSNELRKFTSYSRHYSNFFPLSHTKGILADELTLLMGTGNFTSSGLEDAKEYFFVTKDKKVLDGFKGLINTLATLSGAKAPYRVSLPQIAQERPKFAHRAMVVVGDPKEQKAIPSYLDVKVTDKRRDLWFANEKVSRCLKKTADAYFYSPQAAQACAQQS